MSVQMPFRLYSGYLIVVEGRIGSWKGLKFALDTGTTKSILSKKMADKLVLHRQPALVLTFDKTVDLGRLSEYASHIDAVIGLDLLQRENLTFDYNTRKLLFEPLDIHTYRAQKGSKPICFTVNVYVQGHFVRLIVDTGIEGVLLYEDRVRAQVPELRVEAGIKNVIIGEHMKGKLAILPEMSLGKTALDGRVLLIESAPANMIDGIAGCIGIHELHASRIAFNGASNTIRLE